MDRVESVERASPSPGLRWKGTPLLGLRWAGPRSSGRRTGGAVSDAGSETPAGPDSPPPGGGVFFRHEPRRFPVQLSVHPSTPPPRPPLSPPPALPIPPPHP